MHGKGRGRIGGEPPQPSTPAKAGRKQQRGERGAAGPAGPTCPSPQCRLAASPANGAGCAPSRRQITEPPPALIPTERGLNGSPGPPPVPRLPISLRSRGSVSANRWGGRWRGGGARTGGPAGPTATGHGHPRPPQRPALTAGAGSAAPTPPQGPRTASGWAVGAVPRGRRARF